MRVLLNTIGLFLLFTASAFGQVSRDRIALSSTGQPIRNANVWVCSGNAQVFSGPIPPCSPLATIYSDPGLTQQVTQPLHADTYGNYLYYVATGGTYTEVVTALAFSGWSGVLTYACTPGSSCAWTQTQTFAAPIASTVSTGTAPFSIASTTVVPNLNAQLHNGLTAPATAIVGISDTQTLTNKTFDISANTLKTATNTAGHVPRNNGTQYVDGQLACADLSNATGGCSTALQGTDSTLLTAGTISGTGAALCTDANGGATTSGCTSGGVTESTLSTGAFAVSWNVACTAGSTGHCAYTTFAKAHTLVRITYDLTQAPSSCATNAVVGVRDMTSSTNLSTITVNQGSTGYVDSGALSVAMTAGHEFLVGVITAAATCTTVPNGHSIVAVFQ